MRRKLRAEGYSSVARYLYPMGTVFSDHTHSMDKKDSVLEGEFLITLEGEEFLLHAGDSIEVPANAVHSAQVVGEEGRGQSGCCEALAARGRSTFSELR